MRRVRLPARKDMRARLAAIDFAFPEVGGEAYWVEDAHYAFTLEEIERDLEDPTVALAALCESLVDRVIGDERLLARLKIPEHAWDVVAESRRRDDPSLYGRFDFAYGGTGPAKLLEFNADTPTALFEAAVVQWSWLEDQLERGALAEGTDQFNSIHERLVERIGLVVPGPHLHLTGTTASAEDAGTLAYLADCAVKAGKEATILDISTVGLAGDRFYDEADRPIDTLFKLYPWEWILLEAFSRTPALATTRFVEPAWRMILSNKGILPLLWEMAPGHPNLLPAFFADDPRAERLAERHVRKPLFSREGANVEIVERGRTVEKTGGDYGAEGFVVQSLAPLPDFDGARPVVGSWVIGAAACGIGLREDTTAVTTDRSRFLPHVILA